MTESNHLYLLQQLEQGTSHAERKEILNDLFSDYLKALTTLHSSLIENEGCAFGDVLDVIVTRKAYDYATRL